MNDWFEAFQKVSDIIDSLSIGMEKDDLILFFTEIEASVELRKINAEEELGDGEAYS